MPNKTEVLFFALLVAEDATNGGEVDRWASSVRKRAEEAKDLPKTQLPEGLDVGRLRQAYERPLGADVLGRIAAAMKAWRYEGRHEGLNVSHLKQHLYC